MRKLFITLAATGIAATAMARFDVFNYKSGGYRLQYRADKGVQIINGEKSQAPAFAKRTGSLWGYIIYDEEGPAGPSFLRIYHGEYTQDYASMWWSFDTPNKYVEMSNGTTHSAATGLASLWVAVYQGSTYFYTPVIGKWSEVMEDGDSLKYKLNANGTGYGYGPTGVGGPNAYMAVKDVRLKYNHKLSDLMWQAFVAAGGETNEAAGIAAAEGVINDMINKKAHRDDAAFDLYWNM